MFGGKVRFVSFESGDAAQRGRRAGDNVREPNKQKTIFEAKIYGYRQKCEF